MTLGPIAEVPLAIVLGMSEASSVPATVIFGPHCPHDECSWVECDHSGLVEHPCQNQVECPSCGPDSPQWHRIKQSMAAWLKNTYGTVDVAELRAIEGVSAGAVMYAVLLRDW